MEVKTTYPRKTLHPLGAPFCEDMNRCTGLIADDKFRVVRVFRSSCAFPHSPEFVLRLLITYSLKSYSLFILRNAMVTAS